MGVVERNVTGMCLRMPVEVSIMLNVRVVEVLESVMMMSALELVKSLIALLTVSRTEEALSDAVWRIDSIIARAVAVRRLKCCDARPIPRVSQRNVMHCVSPIALRPIFASDPASANVMLLSGVELEAPVT